MATALTVLLADANSTTLTTAKTLYSIVGAANTGYPFYNSQYTTSLGGTGYFEMWSQGTTAAQTAAGSLPAPTGRGLLFDVTTLEGQDIIAGNWTPTVRLTSMSSSTATGGTQTADLIVRASKRSSDGTYTTIATCTLSAQSLTGTAASYTFAATATGSATSFATGDKLYLDYFVNVTANTGAWGVRFNRFSTDTAGLTGDPNAQVVTPGFQPSLLALPQPRYIPRAFGATIIPDPVSQPLPYIGRAFGATIIYENRTFIPRAFGGVYMPDTVMWVPRALVGTEQFALLRALTLAGTGILTGTLSASLALATTTLAGVGTLSGTLTETTALSTTLAGVGTLSGTFTLATSLTVTIAGVGTLSGTLSTSGGVSLSGTLAGVGTLTGVFSLRVALSLTFAGIGILIPTLTIGGTTIQFLTATWVTRDLAISWVTRDDKTTWDTRDDKAGWGTRDEQASWDTRDELAVWKAR